jgi:hypothetical protein
MYRLMPALRLCAYAQSHWPYTMRGKNGCPSTCSVLSITAPTVQLGNGFVVNDPIERTTAGPRVAVTRYRYVVAGSSEPSSTRPLECARLGVRNVIAKSAVRPTSIVTRAAGEAVHRNAAACAPGSTDADTASAACADGASARVTTPTPTVRSIGSKVA